MDVLADYIPNEAKRRFCKINNIPITIFSPDKIFQSRLDIYDKLYDSRRKWEQFLRDYSTFPNLEMYYEHYNSVKDSAINFIKKSSGFINFNKMDMEKYSIPTKYASFPSKSIYKDTNDRLHFVSIDMRMANFTSLQMYDKSIFGGASTWEEFISGYTTLKSIIESKYIRQVVLGNCNPGRQVAYEKYYMYHILKHLLNKDEFKDSDIESFTNDEIVIRYDGKNDSVGRIMKALSFIPMSKYRIEFYQIFKLGEYGWLKSYTNGWKELKCAEAEFVPMIIKSMEGKTINDEDLYFYYKGNVAKFLAVPEGIKRLEFPIK